jgi:hypothetical protein
MEEEVSAGAAMLQLRRIFVVLLLSEPDPR